MNEKKQKGFKPTYLVTLLVVILLFSLMFVNFGNNGTKLERSEVFEMLNGTYQSEKDGVIEQVDYFITEAKLNDSYIDIFNEFDVKYIQAE